MNETFFSRSYNRVLTTLALVALVAALAAYAYYTLRQAEYLNISPTMITVTGEGEVRAIPDIGQFSFTVTAEAMAAKDAQNDSATKVNAILAYLKEQGVEERDIKTDQYFLNPKYRWQEQPCVGGRVCPPGEQVEDGFEVSQVVSVKVRDIDKAGDLISGVGGRGATNLSGLTFTVDDVESLQHDARKQAIDDAHAQSKELAKQLGVRLVRMTGYFEQGPNVPMPYYGADAMKSAVPMAQRAVAPELPTGEQAVKSIVSLTFLVE